MKKFNKSNVSMSSSKSLVSGASAKNLVGLRNQIDAKDARIRQLEKLLTVNGIEIVAPAETPDREEEL